MRYPNRTTFQQQYPRPLPPAWHGDDRGEEGISSVSGPSAAPRAGEDLRGAFRAQGLDFSEESARPARMAAIVKPWAAIRVRIMSWERRL